MSKQPRVAVYLRVSTKDQTLENQRQALTQWATANGWQGVTEYTDTMSGAKRDRPGFDELLKAVVRREVDVIATWSIDRLGRSVKDLLEITDTASKNEVRLFFYKDAVDTSTPSGQLFFTIMAAVAQFERERIRERIHAGLDRAREEGKAIGRPKRCHPDTALVIQQMHSNGVSTVQISKQLGIPRATVGRVIKDTAAIGTATINNPEE
jgi:DNA invertase Pin-like site-specific DNA recombinase